VGCSLPPLLLVPRAGSSSTDRPDRSPSTENNCRQMMSYPKARRDHSTPYDDGGKVPVGSYTNTTRLDSARFRPCMDVSPRGYNRMYVRINEDCDRG